MNAPIARDVLQDTLGTRLGEGRPGDLLRSTGRDLQRIVFACPIRVHGSFPNAQNSSWNTQRKRRPSSVFQNPLNALQGAPFHQSNWQRSCNNVLLTTMMIKSLTDATGPKYDLEHYTVPTADMT